MAIFALTLVLTLIAALSSEAVSSHRLFIEKLQINPLGWKEIRPAPKSQLRRFQVAVAQPRASDFDEALLNISTPQHAAYGRHWSQDELRDYLRPEPEATASILEWLTKAGVEKTQIKDDGDWISFTTTIGVAEEIMDTHFHVYAHEETGTTRIGTLGYSVPKALHGHIDMIHPTTYFGNVQPQLRSVITQELASTSASNDTSCNATITPDCLRELYKLGNSTSPTGSGVKLGISGYLQQYAQHADLDAFVESFAPYAAGENFSTVSINGGQNIQNSANFTQRNIEANTDMQYGLVLAHDVPTTFYTTGGLGKLVPDLDQPNVTDNQNEPYLDQLSYLLSLPEGKLPTVLSTSYGEDEQSVPAPYARRVCQMFGQLGARGVSVVFSTGDVGVGGACKTNDGTNTTRFTPQFPASCPYVTSVGATHQIEPEVADFYTSGGFSDLFPRPAWQEVAVERYLGKLGDRWAGLYNRRGRGFPDVAAQGRFYSIIDQGKVKKITGTSCSAPTFAAIVAKLNSARRSTGKPALGFLNPWLYSKDVVRGGGLTDIVDGGTIGCTGTDPKSRLPSGYVPYASWNATEGWDPASGLGTPSYPQLVETALRDY